jgi:preprotein translocase subunit SecY
VVEKIIAKIRALFANEKLRNKLFFTLSVFAITRVFTHIPVPVVDVEALKYIFASSQFLSFLNIFSGGTLANFSIAAVGINPYITASIIMQLLGMVVPKIKEMQKEDEASRAKLNQYMRLMSVPIAAVQAISVIALLRSQNLLIDTDPMMLLVVIITLVAGSLVMMWLGEQISERGLGNGISMILLAGIVSQIPTLFAQVTVSADSSQLPLTITMFAMALLVIALVVFMNEAQRKVTIQYAKRIRGGRQYGGQMTHLPIKVNVAGVMPIIFAVSLMMLPSVLGRLFNLSHNPMLLSWGENLTLWFSNTSAVYIVSYFLLVFAFSYFSALLFFKAEDIADELKKSGAFIPGIRPGNATRRFLEFVVTRITFAGAIFLGLIAVLPNLAQLATGIQSLAVGGTSVLIVVSVILETAKQVNSQLLADNYDKYSELG